MSKQLFLGDEAIAQGAIDGGVSGVYAYPGTPSTEIMEYVQGSQQAAELNIHRQWSTNEKTAMEAAIGMSYTGKRAIVCFKHVGLNVAADAFVNAAVTGVNGGLVVVAADDPSMHSSQNEQDSRFYAKFAMIPTLEPANQQEAYDMMYDAFELSERMNTPVLLRVTTRMAHSRAGVVRKNTKPQNKIKLPDDPRQYVLLPAIARKNNKKLLAMQDNMRHEADKSTYNQLIQADDMSKGIVATGIAYNYLMENYNFKCPFPVLKISQYPIPRTLMEKLYNQCNELLVLEEGNPFVEEQLRGFMNNGKPIHGRMDGSVPRDGEINPNIVAAALGITENPTHPASNLVKMRPPSFCQGCGHRDMFEALNLAMEEYGKGHIFGDIGCYTMGALPPFNTINSTVDMGASITMAKGASDAGLQPAVAVIGDSTFTHSGMTGLLDAVRENTPITIIVSDNSTTAMTGGQESSATGRIENICKGIGVEPKHIRVITPLKKNLDQNVKVMKEEIAYQGVSVIIPQRECIQTAARKHKAGDKK